VEQVSVGNTRAGTRDVVPVRSSYYRLNYRNNYRVHFLGCSVVKGARPPSYRAIAAATAARLPAPHVVQKRGVRVVVQRSSDVSNMTAGGHQKYRATQEVQRLNQEQQECSDGGSRVVSGRGWVTDSGYGATKAGNESRGVPEGS
jgi:hypothetical protein